MNVFKQTYGITQSTHFFMMKGINYTTFSTFILFNNDHDEMAKVI